jgi:hypothetical protein
VQSLRLEHGDSKNLRNFGNKPTSTWGYDPETGLNSRESLISSIIIVA